MIPDRKSSDPPFEDGQLSTKVYQAIYEEYLHEFGHHLVYSDLDGNLIYGLPDCSEFPCKESCRLARQQAIEMALSYGITLPSFCPSSYLFRALPVSLNNEVLGALITVVSKQRVKENHLSENQDCLARAQAGLIEIAESYNIINRAFLQQHGRGFPNQALSDQNWYAQPAPDLNKLWEEQGRLLIEKVAHGDRSAACTVMNKILTFFGGVSEDKFSELKGFALGIFAAVIESSEPYKNDRQLLFSLHCNNAEKIVLSRSLLELSTCIQNGLQTVLEVNCCRHSNDKRLTVRKVHNYIEKHLESALSREEVAREVGLSPSRLSHLIKEETNQSLSDIVKRFRLDHACQLLLRTDKSISEIAIEAGFCDQSHFTKVFHKRHEISPVEYRRKNSLRS